MRLDPSAYRSLGEYGTLGLEFVFSVVLGLYGGRWLDQKFGTSGALTFVGLVLGVVAGFRAIWRVAKRAEREASRDEPGPPEGPDGGPPHS
ncbi:MAG TPA: AtpZ/AtpI family protein [Polyangiaceae bacterium]|nr:AtpZ/AtpI family protein [Polyangiaceae bacterium]